MDDRDYQLQQEREIAKARQRSAQAKEVFTNPIYREAIEGLQREYLARFKAIPVHDDKGRFSYQVALNVLDAVERHLKSVVESGSIPDTTQDFQENKPSLLRRLF